MIDFLRGKLAHKETDYVVLDVHGVGYRVFCANPSTIASDMTGELTLFIHHSVREDAIVLFGFETRDEQTIFRKLLIVTGIGPRVALGILSAARPVDVVSAIYQEDVEFLTKLPGIGKKTAQRIILDLKDKLADLPINPLAGSGAPTVARLSTPSLGHASWQEAKLALLALGYTESEIDRVWPSIQQKYGDSGAVDVLIKHALQVLFNG